MDEAVDAVPTYCVVDWDRYFENAASRKVNFPRWVPMPNQHDGGRYRRLTRHPQGEVVYGAWCLIVQVASRCPVRGVLADEHGPITAARMEDKTGFIASIFTLAFSVLTDPDIGWLVARYQDATRPNLEASSALGRKGREVLPPLPPQGGGLGSTKKGGYIPFSKNPEILKRLGPEKPP